MAENESDICPSCGALNHCVMASNRNEQYKKDAPIQCWCMAKAYQFEVKPDVNVDPHDCCLCPACLAKLVALGEETKN